MKTGYIRDIPLGKFCETFCEELIRIFTEWEDDLYLIMDEEGNPLSLELMVRAPNRLKNLTLLIKCNERESRITIDFDTASTEFYGAFEAVRYISFITDDEIVCVTRIINGNFESSWLAESARAVNTVRNLMDEPKGCLGFLSPARQQDLSITSWSGKLDMGNNSSI